jgi:hypothetical protein
VQDQVIRHDLFTDVFNRAYLNHWDRFNVQDMFFEEDLSDDGLTCIFTHMSIICNENTLKGVLREVIDTLSPDPEIVELERRHNELYYTIQDWYKFTSQAPEINIVKDEDHDCRFLASLALCTEKVIVTYKRAWTNTAGDVLE